MLELLKETVEIACVLSLVTAQTDLGLASILMPANFLMLTKHAGGGTLVLAA